MEDLPIDRRHCGGVAARLWPPSHNRLGSPSHEKAQPTVALVCQSRQSRHALAANNATLPVGCLAVLRLARPCNHVPVQWWSNIAPSTPQCRQAMQHMLAPTPLCKLSPEPRIARSTLVTLSQSTTPTLAPGPCGPCWSRSRQDRPRTCGQSSAPTDGCHLPYRTNTAPTPTPSHEARVGPLSRHYCPQCSGAGVCRLGPRLKLHHGDHGRPRQRSSNAGLFVQPTLRLPSADCSDA